MTPAALGSAGSSLAVYVHMPWCVRKCPYCDFNSHQLKSGRPDDAYLDALLADFDADSRWAAAGRRVESVFFGGGTPSLFGPPAFARLLEGLRQRIEFAADAEITLEANPGTIERGRFDGYREAGINRVSLGAQTFSPAALQRLGRIHTAEDTHRAVAELRCAGIENFNLDLMYALPGQTLEEALVDVRTACSLGPTHLSYYQLTLEPGTVFHTRPPSLPDEDAAWSIQTECQRLLAAAGYRQYEVSAYAQDGRQCRHNLNYWCFGDYLGLGAGAHGKITFELPANVVRTTKAAQPRDYQVTMMNGSGKGGDRRLIPVCDLPFEFMLNALRLNEGFPVGLFQAQTGLSPGVIEAKLADARRQGLMDLIDNRWIPTDLGRRFLNDLQASFLP